MNFSDLSRFVFIWHDEAVKLQKKLLQSVISGFFKPSSIKIFFIITIAITVFWQKMFLRKKEALNLLTICINIFASFFEILQKLSFETIFPGNVIKSNLNQSSCSLICQKVLGPLNRILGPEFSLGPRTCKQGPETWLFLLIPGQLFPVCQSTCFGT